MKLVVGQSLTSLVDATTLIVVRCPDTDLKVLCGGHEMTTQAPPSPRPVASPDAAGEALLMGKRYTVEGLELELLCVRPGPYPVTVDGVTLVQKNAKPLPASD